MLISVLSLLLMMTINKNGCLSWYEKNYLPLIERTHLNVDDLVNVEHLSPNYNTTHPTTARHSTPQHARARLSTPQHSTVREMVISYTGQ